MEAFLNRLAYLESAGESAQMPRIRTCCEVRKVLTAARATSLTRPGGLGKLHHVNARVVPIYRPGGCRCAARGWARCRWTSSTVDSSTYLAKRLRRAHRDCRDRRSGPTSEPSAARTSDDTIRRIRVGSC